MPCSHKGSHHQAHFSSHHQSFLITRKLLSLLLVPILLFSYPCTSYLTLLSQNIAVVAPHLKWLRAELTRVDFHISAQTKVTH